MATFERARPRTPQRIGDIEVRLVSHDPQGLHAAYGNVGRILLQVVDDAGGVTEISDDLARHVDAAALAAIRQMIDGLRAKATTEALPEKSDETGKG